MSRQTQLMSVSFLAIANLWADLVECKCEWRTLAETGDKMSTFTLDSWSQADTKQSSHE